VRKMYRPIDPIRPRRPNLGRPARAPEFSPSVPLGRRPDPL